MGIGPLTVGFIMYKSPPSSVSHLIHGGALARPGIVIEGTEN